MDAAFYNGGGVGEDRGVVLKARAEGGNLRLEGESDPKPEDGG